MNRLTFIVFAVLPLFWLQVGLAEETVASRQYTYDTVLDIAEVISIEEPEPLVCEVVQAKITYLDSKGELKATSYKKQSRACSIL